MNFILKLAYLYKVTEKKKLIYMHLLLLFIVLCIMWLTRTSRKKKIDSSRICSSVYIISKKKIPVYMHIVIYIVVLWLLYIPGPQFKTKMILPGGSGSLGYYFLTWGFFFLHVISNSTNVQKQQTKR